MKNNKKYFPIKSKCNKNYWYLATKNSSDADVITYAEIVANKELKAMSEFYGGLGFSDFRPIYFETAQIAQNFLELYEQMS